MYCPTCGKENTGGERFCRSCGMKLETIARVAAAEAAGLPVRDLEARADRRPLRMPLPVVGFVLFMTGTLFAYLGADVFALHWVVVLATITLIFGMGLLGVGTMTANRPRRLRESRPETSPFDSNRSPEIQSGPARAAIPEPAASVTENTTRHLDAEKEPMVERVRDTQQTL